MHGNSVQNIIDVIATNHRSFAEAMVNQHDLKEECDRAPVKNAGHKRKHVEQLQASSSPAQLRSYLDHLLLDVIAIPETVGIPRDSMLEAHLAAFSSYAYFFVHSVPLKVHAAQRSGGPILSRDVVLRMVQTLLAAGGPASASKYERHSYPHAVLKYLLADLSTARNTLRAEFCDDYDDCRVAVLKCIRDSCKERNERVSAMGREIVTDGSDLTARQLETATLPRTAVLCCDADVFARNAVDLLLGITLPSTERQWDAADRTSFAAAQIGMQLQEFARRNGIALQWSSDALHIVSSGASGPASSATTVHGAVNVLSSMADSDDESVGSAGGHSRKRIRRQGDDRSEQADAGAGGLEATLGGALAKLQAAEARAKAQAAPAASSSVAEPVGPSWAMYSTQCKAYAEAWLAVLRCPLPPDCLRRVLIALPGRILPFFHGNSPLQLADFLRHCVDGGGPAALLALAPLFTLMQTHGLEYPQFYPRLYALLGSPEASATRYKARFLVLLDLFLSSPALPVYLVCAFAKRLAHTALLGSGSPAYAVLALAVIHNLHTRHPSAMSPLFHRSPGSIPSDAGTASKATSWPSYPDAWNALTDDPAASGAALSSLWELHALASHYCPHVAQAAKAFSEPSDASRAQIDVAGLSGADSGGSTTPAKARKTTSHVGKPGSNSSGYKDLIKGELQRSTREDVAHLVHWEHIHQHGLLFAAFVR